MCGETATVLSSSVQYHRTVALSVLQGTASVAQTMPSLLKEHEALFTWHCRQFYPFDSQLNADELRYLRTCFSLAESHQQMSASGYRRLSYYSYSHRVSGTEVNSSRIAFGSLEHPGKVWESAQPVLERRRVHIAAGLLETSACAFGGLGWDLLAGHFKVYFYLADLAELREPGLVELFKRDVASRREGLVSFTFVDGGELHEEKVYMYPSQDGVEQPHEESQDVAIMSTSKRGLVQQLNVADSSVWMTRLNAVGRRIIYRYADINESLDTIAYTDPEHYTLYFP